MTRTDVRPSYDGQSLIDEDSVAKRRSVCQGQPTKEKTNISWSFSFAVGHPTEMNYPSNILYCSRLYSYFV